MVFQKVAICEMTCKKNLQEDKENVNLWLDFVEFQDELFQDQIEKAENGKNISSKALNEKKVNIYVFEQR